MNCRRCHRGDCPGCSQRRDCADCGYTFDADHLNDRGHCGGCVERRAVESLADAAVSPEVIRVAVAQEREAIAADILAGADSLESEARRMAAGSAGGVSIRLHDATVYRYLAGRIRSRGVSP